MLLSRNSVVIAHAPIFFKKGPWVPVSWLEKTLPGWEVATKDHSSSNPSKGNPSDPTQKVDVSKVDVKTVKGFPKCYLCCTSIL